MYVCVSFTFGFEGGMRDIIDLFYIIFAHAYMGHVARYFSDNRRDFTEMGQTD